jgi:hypothetical protein
MYKFTQKQVDLMEALGHMTDKEMCYEGYQEAYWEQRANGIPAEKSFTKWLERGIVWKAQVQTLRSKITA